MCCMLGHVYINGCITRWLLPVGLSSSKKGQQSRLSILNRVMPGGGGDLDLSLDNDTIQSHMWKSGATFPRGNGRGGR